MYNTFWMYLWIDAYINIVNLILGLLFNMLKQTNMLTVNR